VAERGWHKESLVRLKRGGGATRGGALVSKPTSGSPHQTCVSSVTGPAPGGGN
jgi:hypothetical protein